MLELLNCWFSEEAGGGVRGLMGLGIASTRKLLAKDDDSNSGAIAP